MYSRDAGVQKFTKHSWHLERVGRHIFLKRVFLGPPPSPPYTGSGAWVAPPRPASHPGRARRGGCGGKSCGEAGSAPIWRAAVARKQGAEEPRLVSRPSVSFPSFPVPPPYRRSERRRDPNSRWEAGGGGEGRKRS